MAEERKFPGLWMCPDGRIRLNDSPPFRFNCGGMELTDERQRVRRRGLAAARRTQLIAVHVSGTLALRGRRVPRMANESLPVCAASNFSAASANVAGSRVNSDSIKPRWN